MIIFNCLIYKNIIWQKNENSKPNILTIIKCKYAIVNINMFNILIMGCVDVSEWVRVISDFKLLNELIFVFDLYLFI